MLTARLCSCLTCRRRKTRCDGEKPTCATCEKNGQPCAGYQEHSSPDKFKDDHVGLHVNVEAGRILHHVSAAGPDQNANEDVVEQDDGRQHKRDPAHTSHVRRDSAQVTSKKIPPLHIRNDNNGWDTESSIAQPTPGRPFSNPRTVSFSEDGRSGGNTSPVPRHADTHKVPYFRYFGPTAIVPGLKQMVVNAPVHSSKRRRGSRGSTSATSPLSLLSLPSHADTVLEPMDELPAYDPNDKAPVPDLIIKLVQTFFLHLGYIHPYLREEKILRLVKEKQVASILVDAMCALAARFANFDGVPAALGSSRSDYGNVFAQRAKAATVDTFPCPTVSAVQAYLLMAYEGFGANQDSALWMYLGLAIRMAFDLGLQKNEGVQYHGEKDPWNTNWNRSAADEEDDSSPVVEEGQLDPKEQQEIVQERIDTAWAVYILDRVISTGTGRTATVRDDEFELPIPQPSIDASTGLPTPYPVFAHIIQLYGRVSDIINKLKKPSDLTHGMLATLAKIERELTGLYRKQDPRLHFNPLHFQNYVKNGQGTLFILLHVWFHSCIIILHQPLLTPFGNQRRQLTPTSRELAMSSAKTIADILALAELIDPNSYLSSPFTSQPMYIAGCAFLVQSASHSSQPPSRAASPGVDRQAAGASSNGGNGKSGHSGDKSAKHLLLAEAVMEGYQRCYKSLQQVQEYWGGVKYILNALDHRSKGVWDCETYTAEEYASTKLHRRPALANFPHRGNTLSPTPNVPPLAWSLTGTTNSPNSSLGLLWQNTKVGPSQAAQPLPAPPVSTPTPPGNWRFDPVRPDLPTPYSPPLPQPSVSAVRGVLDAPNSNRLSGRHFGMRFDGHPPSAGSPGTPGSDTRLPVLSGAAGAQGNFAIPYTPSSTYESSTIPSVASPPNAAAAAADVGTAEMIGPYGHDYSQNDMASGWNNLHPVTIMVEQFDLGSVDLNNDLFQAWDFFPGGNSIPGLFNPVDLGDVGDQGQL